jgi:hypothetical protein
MHFTHQVFKHQADALYTFYSLENYLKQLLAAKGRAVTGVNLTFRFHWGLLKSIFNAAIYWVWSFHYPDRKHAMFPN